MRKKIDALEDLREEVKRLQPKQSLEAISSIEAANAKLTACSNENPERPFVNVRLGGKEFTYATISTSADTYCIYLVEPAGRALSIDEARDFSAALMMGIPATEQAPAITLGRSEDGEAQFKKLRDAVSLGGLKPIVPQLTAPDGSLISTPSKATDKLVGCSDVPPTVLASHPGQEFMGFVYNASYRWKRIVLADGEICYYVISPIGRGLSFEEAYDFAAAISNGMTPPSELQQAAPVEEQPQAPTMRGGHRHLR